MSGLGSRTLILTVKEAPFEANHALEDHRPDFAGRIRRRMRERHHVAASYACAFSHENHVAASYACAFSHENHVARCEHATTRADYIFRAAGPADVRYHSPADVCCRSPDDVLLSPE